MVTNLTNRTSGLEVATTKLGNALSSSQIRGGWGEQELKRLVESAGMREHLDDFATQVPTDLADDSGRPDMAIAVPGGMRILVDSKVPLDALRSAFETDDEEERARYLKAHADSLRTLVINLAGKDYPSKFDNTLDFVLLFVPGDHFLDLALSQRPELLEEALNRRVILTSPSSFFAVLLAISHTWRQQRLADNAKAIQQESSNLYKRLRTVVDHIEKVGTGLRRAGKAYNDAIGSIDRNLITSAERIDALGGSDGREPIELPEPLDIDLVDSRKRDLLPEPPIELRHSNDAGAPGTAGDEDPEPGEPVRPQGD
jgi:DNA recombination protein RmuC